MLIKIKTQKTLFLLCFGHHENMYRELKILVTEIFLKYDFSKRSILNPFDENTASVAKLPIEIHNQLIKLSADKI